MSKTYYSKVLDHLSENPITIEELIVLMNVPSTKQTYIIDAIKKGLDLNTITQIKNPLETKRLYLGHTYCKK
jgi:hypothetical protein